LRTACRAFLGRSNFTFAAVKLSVFTAESRSQIGRTLAADCKDYKLDFRKSAELAAKTAGQDWTSPSLV
jgi:hypothetical protein